MMLDPVLTRTHFACVRNALCAVLCTARFQKGYAFLEKGKTAEEAILFLQEK